MNHRYSSKSHDRIEVVLMDLYYIKNFFVYNYQLIKQLTLIFKENIRQSESIVGYYQYLLSVSSKFILTTTDSEISKSNMCNFSPYNDLKCT